VPRRRRGLGRARLVDARLHFLERDLERSGRGRFADGRVVRALRVTRRAELVREIVEDEHLCGRRDLDAAHAVYHTIGRVHEWELPQHARHLHLPRQQEHSLVVVRGARSWPELDAYAVAVDAGEIRPDVGHAQSEAHRLRRDRLARPAAGEGVKGREADEAPAGKAGGAERRVDAAGERACVEQNAAVEAAEARPSEFHEVVGILASDQDAVLKAADAGQVEVLKVFNEGGHSLRRVVDDIHAAWRRKHSER